MRTIILIFAIHFISAVAVAAPISRSMLPSEQGKWLATLAIGGPDLIENATDDLSSGLTDLFSGTSGGDYQLISALSDTIRPITTKDLYSFFGDIKEQNLSFKKKHPNRESMLILGLTGHGLIEDGQYYFMTNNGRISGEELVSLIAALEVDELIVLVQSCFSGGIANVQFPELFKNYPEHKRVSVIAPVTQNLSSPVFIMENILRRSNTSLADWDGNGIITYEEWLNSLLKESYQSHYYIGQGMLSAGYPSSRGIDFQIFERGIGAGLPMFVTPTYDFRYGDDLEGYSRAPIIIYEETMTVRQEEEQFVYSLLQSSLRERDFTDLLYKTSSPNRVKRLLLLLETMSFRQGIDDPLAHVLGQLFVVGDIELKRMVITIFEISAPYSGDSEAVDRVYDLFVDEMYDGNDSSLAKKIKMLLYRAEHPW